MGLQTNCCCCEGTTHCIDASEAFVTGCAPGTSSGSVGSPLPRYLRVKLGSALACCGGNLNGTFTLKYVSGCLWQSGVIDCAGLLPGTGSPSFPTSIMLTIGFTSILTVNLNNGNTITYTKTAHWHSLCPNEMQITSPPTDCDGVLTKICVYPEIDPVCCVLAPNTPFNCLNGMYSTFEFDLNGTAGGYAHDNPTVIPVYIRSQTEQVGAISIIEDPEIEFGAGNECIYTPRTYPNTRQLLVTLTYDSASDSWKGSTTSFPGQPSGPTMRMEMFYGGADPDFPCIDSNFLWGHLWTDEMVANGFPEDTICVSRKGTGPSGEQLYWYTIQEFDCHTSGTASGIPYMTYSDWSPYLPYFIYKRPQQYAIDISGFICITCNTAGNTMMMDDPNGIYILTRLTGASHTTPPSHGGNATAPNHCGNWEYDFGGGTRFCGDIETTIHCIIGNPSGTGTQDLVGSDVNAELDLVWNDADQCYRGTTTVTRKHYKVTRNSFSAIVARYELSTTFAATVELYCDNTGTWFRLLTSMSGSDEILCATTYNSGPHAIGFAFPLSPDGISVGLAGCSPPPPDGYCARLGGVLLGEYVTLYTNDPDSDGSNISCRVVDWSLMFTTNHTPNSCPQSIFAVLSSVHTFNNAEIPTSDKDIKVFFNFDGGKQTIWNIESDLMNPWGNNTLVHDAILSTDPSDCSMIPSSSSLNFVSFLPEPVTP